jgi:hypothetical protein
MSKAKSGVVVLANYLAKQVHNSLGRHPGHCKKSRLLWNGERPQRVGSRVSVPSSQEFPRIFAALSEAVDGGIRKT